MCCQAFSNMNIWKMFSCFQTTTTTTKKYFYGTASHNNLYGVKVFAYLFAYRGRSMDK